MTDISALIRYRLTDHVQFEMERRGISETEIAQVLSAPGQAHLVRPGRVVYQSRLEPAGEPKPYLLRVFVDIDHEPAAVVTAYRTSKIEKYWKREP